MKTPDLISAVRDWRLEQLVLVPNEVSPYEIFNIQDIEVLRQIARHRSKFVFLTKTETWELNSSRQFILGSMDRLCAFLEEVANGGCRCLKYRYISCDPDAEAAKGLVAITEKEDDQYSSHYRCVCVACNSCFSVSQQEERFGYSNIWTLRNQI